MLETRKVLGQLDVGAAAEATLYTVPAATQAVVSTVIVCNRGAVATTFRIRIRVAGVATDVKQYIYYDVPIPGNDTFAATIGICLGAGDLLTVEAGTTDVSFGAFGVELT